MPGGFHDTATRGTTPSHSDPLAGMSRTRTSKPPAGQAVFHGGGMARTKQPGGTQAPQYYRMVEAFFTLNHTGAEKAAVAVEDLAKVPEYRREDGAGGPL